MEQGTKILEIKNLSISFRQYESGLKQRELQTIRDMNLTICAGEMVAVVGESGSGKSLLAHSILGILPYNAIQGGEMFYQGERLTEEKKRSLRGNEIALIPQSIRFLNPLMKIGPQIRKGKKDKETREKLDEIFREYELEQNVQELYPFELSGGMNRRVLNATARMGNPKLVIADEPTPGLHMDMVRRVMSHFREMADDGAGVLVITHDLEQALAVADRVVVLYEGKVVENTDVRNFDSEETLKHPYAKALWRALPQNGLGLEGVL